MANQENTKEANMRPRPVRKPKCDVCCSSEKDELNLGEMHSAHGFNVHYYCLLLASTIEQSGEDEDGILGFLPTDIKAELVRSQSRFCTYCKKRGAAVLCNSRNCKVMFHLPCGIKNESGHQFQGRFISHCAIHRFKQKIPVPTEEQSCPICFEVVEFSNKNKLLWAPCCKKKSYFHKQCLQRMALSAGYYFKCPICNNVDIFQKTMKQYGVYIPHRDASWELEPNAFEDLLYRHEECNVEVCQCPHGRVHSGMAGRWLIVLCDLCGNRGTHIKCSNIISSDSTWHCDICVPPTPESSSSVTQPGPSGVRIADGFRSASGVRTSGGIRTAGGIRTLSGVRTSGAGGVRTAGGNVSDIDQPQPSTSRQYDLDLELPSTSRAISPYTSPTSTCTSETIAPDQTNNQTIQTRKRKLSTSGSTSNHVNSDKQSAANLIEIDSDDDIMVIEDGDSDSLSSPQKNKTLVAHDGRIIAVRTISLQEKDVMIQGDLNIAERTRSSTPNFVISDVRSLNGSAIDTNTSTSNRSHSHSDNKQVSNSNNTNCLVYLPTNIDPNQRKSDTVSIIDKQGNVYVLKEITGYQLMQTRRSSDRNQNQNTAPNKSDESDIVVID